MILGAIMEFSFRPWPLLRRRARFRFGKQGFPKFFLLLCEALDLRAHGNIAAGSMRLFGVRFGAQPLQIARVVGVRRVSSSLRVILPKGKCGGMVEVRRFRINAQLQKRGF